MKGAVRLREINATPDVRAFCDWWRDQVKPPMTEPSARIAATELAREAFLAGWNASQACGESLDPNEPF